MLSCDRDHGFARSPRSCPLPEKEKRMKQQCEDDIHDWEYSSWGVIIGVSKCRKCGKVAKEKDFVVSANFEQMRKEK